MLSPDELAVLPERLVAIYRDLEISIIKDIARRIASSGAMTESAIHQINMLKDMGYPQKEIDAAIQSAVKMGSEELDALYTEAVERSQQFDKEIRDKAGILPQTGAKVKQLVSYADAVKKQTADTIKNISASLGFSERVGGETVFKPIAKFYQDTLNFAHMQVASGSFDHETAIKQAVKKMSDSRLRTVDYASGWVNQVDVAVRRATMTGLSQVTAHIAEQTAKELGTDLVEVSAHAGARPDHAAWQGKVYSLKGGSRKYPNLAEATGYGSGDGLMGWNCRHSMYPFIEGVSERAYTDEDLRNIDPRPFVYEGRTYNAYEATQMQRKLETAMRKSKCEMAANDTDMTKDVFTSAAIKLRRQREYYEDFSKKARLKTQYERAQSVGYGKRLSGKATAINKKAKSYQSLAGTMTADGTKITGVSTHLSERAITRDIASKDIADALTKPLKKCKIKPDSRGNKSVEYIGSSARVIINPDTGNIITVWKTSTKLRTKLKGG